MNTKITIGQQIFDVSPGFLETLSEIAFVNRYKDSAQSLQQAVTLLYLLSREKHEKGALAILQYPNGEKCNIEFSQEVMKPVFKTVSSIHDTPQKSAFEQYKKPMTDYAVLSSMIAENDSQYD